MIKKIYPLAIGVLFFQFVSLSPLWADEAGALTNEINRPADQSVSGAVTDAETGEPLVAASVVVKGTTIGTSTNTEGRFSLNVPDEATTLVVSSVGYLTREIPINGRAQVDIQLQANVESLEEMVVIGYGEQKREDLTGSISTVKMNEVARLPVTNFQTAIQGKVAGVTVSTSSGEPGQTPQIKIRGTGSIGAGNDPLYVINGIPMPDNTDLRIPISRQENESFRSTPPSPLAGINTNNIESINILKGPSATAIYGSRGSNGVVIITTKQGNKGLQSPQVSFNTYAGWQEAAHLPKLMNSKEIISLTEDSRNNYYIQTYDPLNPSSPYYNPDYDPHTNAGRDNRPAGATIDDNNMIPDQYVDWDGKTNTDWLGLVLGKAAIQDYNLSVSGGSERSSYFLSGEYFGQEGIVKGSNFRRYSLNTSLSSDVIEDRLKIGANLMFSFNDRHQKPANAPYFAQPPGIVYSAMVATPVISPFEPDGTPNQLHGQAHLSSALSGGQGGTSDASNPIAIRNAVHDRLKHTNLIGNLHANLKIVEGLEFETSFGGTINYFDRTFFLDNQLLYRTATEPEPYAQQDASLGMNWVSNNTFTYTPDLGSDHSLKILAGFTSQDNTIQNMAVFSDHQPDNKVSTVGGGIVTGGSGYKGKWSLVSYLGRANYSFKSKYLLTASIRSDKSSRFGWEKQTGVFPSAAAAWRIDQEPFLNSDAISQLKVRVEYGTAGNFNIPDYGSFSLLGEANYVLGDNEILGLGPINLANEKLSWETSNEFDGGIDLGLFQNRLEINFDYYNRITKDLLLNVTVPSSLGFETVLTNIGKVRNRGVELAVRSQNFISDFTWTTEINFAANRNKVLALGPDNAPIRSAGAAGIRHITQVGSPIASYYGYVADGVYMNQAELDKGPEDELAPDRRPGDIRFKDVNGDGKVTTADRTTLGNYMPKFTYGMTNNFAYKNFDLSIFIQGVEGRKILNLTARHLKNGEANFNSYAIENNRWRSEEEPGDGVIPRADRDNNAHGFNNRESSFQVEDGSYFRLKNISLGYTLPVLKDFAQNIRVYFQANNVAISTKYIGFNPEVNFQPTNNLVQGEDYGAYPIARSFTFGIDVNF